MTEPFKFALKNGHEPLSPETWREYFEMNGARGIGGFHDATYDTVLGLEQIISSSDDFTTLKEQILSFIDNRKELLEAAHPDHWCLMHEKNCKDYEAFIKKDLPHLFAT